MSKSTEKNSSDHRVVWLPKPELSLIWEYRGNISNPDEGKIWALVLQGYVEVQLPLKVENAQSQLKSSPWLQSQPLFILPHQVLYKLVSPGDSLPLGIHPSFDRQLY